MAFSADEGKLFFKDWIGRFNPATILDIGAGSGDYQKRLREIETEKPYIKKAKIDAVEIFEPYVERFDLKSKYDNVFSEDIRTFVDKMGNYDLIILGDVVEHIPKADMVVLWEKLKLKSKYLWISVPVLKTPLLKFYSGYDQGESEWQENIYEKHVALWEYTEIENILGPFIWKVPFKIVIIFIAEGML